MTTIEALEVLNKYRCQHYNSPEYEEVELAMAIDSVIVPFSKMFDIVKDIVKREESK